MSDSRSHSPNESDYPTVYGLWTNQGGVGKTTLTFHLATTYAKLFPDKVVVAIDMCPQANLSNTLLTSVGLGFREPGDVKVEKLHGHPLVLRNLPKTVGGFFINCSYDRRPVNTKEWIINVRNGVDGVITGNEQVPDNLYLFCGDRTLDLLVEPLSVRASGAPCRTFNPYRSVHMDLHSFVADLARVFRQGENPKETVFFIDTNPALSLYTQIALVAMTQLIIPVDADSFSMQAVKQLFHSVYGLYPAAGLAAEFGSSTFAHKAQEYQIPLPKISAIVHNKSPVVKQLTTATANPPAPGVQHHPPAYQWLADGHAFLLFDGYQRAMQMGDLDRVFLTRGAQPYQTLLQFSAAYTGTMRNMRSCGVAALYTGLPLYLLQDEAHLIPAAFKGRNFARKVPFLVRDFLVMMQVVFGDELMQQADAATMNRLQVVAGEADLAPAGADDDE